VDVHRKDNVGSLEKAITIYGNPENCTNACKKILEVMQQEANNTNKGYATIRFALTVQVAYRRLFFQRNMFKNTSSQQFDRTNNWQGGQHHQTYYARNGYENYSI